MTRAWRDEFSAFTERKTSEAIAASIPPYTTEFLRPDSTLIGIGNSWSHSRFDGPFFVTDAAEQTRPVVSLVFVQSAQGNTGATQPGTLGGGDTDKHVVYEGLSRVAADAVLAGANTVRDGQTVFSVWHPELVDLRQSLGLARHPAQIIATAAGVDVDRGLLFNVPAFPVVLLTTFEGARRMKHAVADRSWIRMIEMERPDRIEEAMIALHGLGIHQISCVGGRTLARSLLEWGLIHDVYVTTSPKPGGEANTPMFTEPLNGSLVLRKHGTGAEAGVVFEHFHLREQAWHR